MSLKLLIVAAALGLLGLWLGFRRKGPSAKPSPDDDDTTIYVVVINDELQYSLWPEGRELPKGWKPAGKTGQKQECLDYIETVWTDLRPLSVRRAAEAQAASGDEPKGEDPIFNAQHVAQAFSEGEVVASGNTLRFKTHLMGELALPSGSVVACDPLVCPETKPFTERVPPGKYPVDLAVAVLPGGDERVAFARLRFHNSTPVSWRMALLEGQDPKTLQPGEIFGYGVDAGTGCFMDPKAGRILTAGVQGENESSDDLLQALEETSRNTWSWAVLALDEKRNLKVFAFSSGYGDGVYPSFFGFDETGRVVCLVTDFGVVPTADTEPGR